MDGCGCEEYCNGSVHHEFDYTGYETFNPDLLGLFHSTIDGAGDQQQEAV
jgi:hypothetical protein